MPVNKPYEGTFYLWSYVPSLPAAAVTVALFGILTSAVVWRSISTRTRFAIPFALGGLLEVIGYIARAAAPDRTDSLPIYIIQGVFILVAPALFAASIYMVLSRLARSVHGERHLVIGPRWLTRLFVCGDIFSFLVQAAGGSLLANSSFSKQTAQNIILAGLFIQIILFGLFAVTTIIFHIRMRKWPSAASSGGGTNAGVPWQRIVFMMYTVSALIMVRSITRVVDYIMGKDGYLLTHEWTLYVFDSLFMVSTMAVFVLWYPGRLTPPAHEWNNVEAGDGSTSRLDTGDAVHSMPMSHKMQK